MSEPARMLELLAGLGPRVKVLRVVKVFVQQEQTGHRGRKDEPLCRIRRILTMASERLDDTANPRPE